MIKKSAVILSLVLAFSWVGAARIACAAGQAPDFTLEDTQGNQHTLSKYRGKFVVLEWTNYDCPFVKKHYSTGNMQTLQAKHTGNGVIWLSINSSAEGLQGHYSPKEWNKMIEAKKAVPTAVLLDPKGKVGRLYGAKTTPHMFLISPEGNTIYQGAIDSIASTDPDDVEEAINFIDAAIYNAKDKKMLSHAATVPYGCSVKYEKGKN